MGRGFPITRWVFGIGAIIALGWLVTSLPGPVSPPDVDDPPAARATAGSGDGGTSRRQAAALVEEAGPVWRKRRARLVELDRALRTEPDRTRAAALRETLTTVLSRSVREVQRRRLARARDAGRLEMVRYFEHALAGGRTDTADTAAGAGTTTDAEGRATREETR